jgi:hypothetical protein
VCISTGASSHLGSRHTTQYSILPIITTCITLCRPRAGEMRTGAPSIAVMVNMSSYCRLDVHVCSHICLFFFFLFVCRPIFTGFFFKLWDQVFNTNYPDSCKCFLCRPARSEKEWKDLPKPDYSVLLSPTWWIKTAGEKIASD